MKDKILDEAVRLFNINGANMNLDELSTNIKISKKTIYKNFKNKEDLILSAIDKLFDDISNNEKIIFNDDSIDPLEKLRRIITFLPNNYVNLDPTQVNELAKKYPKVKEKLDYRLSNGWDTTLKIINICKDKHLIKDINIDIFRAIITGSLERLMYTENLNMSYDEASKIMVNTIIDGIIIR